MSPQQQPTVGPGHFVSMVLKYPKLWLVPAAAVAVLVGLYALVRPATWEASQALIVRNEAANNQEPVGKFSHSEQMKTVQETILELVNSRGVLTAALKEVGTPAGCRKASELWPGAGDVADLRDNVTLSPPKGAEFGTTEIFYLKVRSKHRDRAVALAGAISNQLETRFQQLRDATAKSMIDELVKAVNLAKDDLSDSTARLTQIEKHVGSDLAELRILHDSSSGESALRRTITEIRNELRQTSTARKSNQQLLALLEHAKQNPDRLVATPNELLESQPALRRLKEGLVDAQLRTAQLQGRMSIHHPLVKAAKEAEQEIRRHLHNELTGSIRAIQVELQLNADRMAMLDGQLAAGTARLDRLAALRADYSNLVSETGNRSELLKRAEQKLCEARMSQATAGVASLIGRIDGPETGIKPVSASRSLIILAGLVGGLMVGFGVLLLTVEPLEPAAVQSHQAVCTPSSGPTLQINGSPNAAAESGSQPLTVKQALQKIAHSHPWN